MVECPAIHLFCMAGCCWLLPGGRMIVCLSLQHLLLLWNHGTSCGTEFSGELWNLQRSVVLFFACTMVHHVELSFPANHGTCKGTLSCSWLAVVFTNGSTGAKLC